VSNPIKKTTGVISMKKAAAVILSAVLGITALSACSSVKTDRVEPVKNESKGIAYHNIAFEEIKDAETLPVEIRKAIEALRKKKGYMYFKTQEGYLVFIGSGEKPTGGYDIKVRSVEDIEGITKITVQEIAPKPEDIVTEALTYPFVIVRVKGVAENFQVFNDKGQKFEDLSGRIVKNGDSYLEVIQVDGQYSGQIDGNSIEVIVNGEANAFRHEGKFQEMVEKLRQGDTISVCYYENEHGQLIITQILQVVFTGS
jgi:PrcB C-terminal